MIVVYTTIFGGSDSLKPAPKGADRCICFVDDPSAYPDAKGWELQQTEIVYGPRRTAWHLRCVAHELFPKADRTVWIDASFTLTNLRKLLIDAGSADIAAIRHHLRHSHDHEGRTLVKVGQSSWDEMHVQLEAYKRAGFTSQHLSISCVIVRTNSAKVQRFNETWDAEIRKHPGDNTQVSLDYSAWVNGMAIKALQGRRRDNPYATHDARDHQRRRKPYRVAA